MKTILLLIILSSSLAVLSQKKVGKKHYRIYSFDAKKEISIKELVAGCDSVDVLFYGESHNDSVTHYLEEHIYKEMVDQYDNVSLSMEMFTSETQEIVDEYLSSKISEKHFVQDANAWSNYRDYRPMVEFAKSNDQKVIAANAPFRYVSLVNKRGQSAINDIGDYFRSVLAPIPYDTAVGEEYKFLMTLMHDDKDDKDAPIPYFNINQGQSLWNATMAFNIAKYFKGSSETKIFQVNGKFHSDRNFGVVKQLKKYAPNAKIKTISAGSDEDFPNVDYSKYLGIADYIIITDPKVPTTY